MLICPKRASTSSCVCPTIKKPTSTCSNKNYHCRGIGEGKAGDRRPAFGPHHFVQLSWLMFVLHGDATAFTSGPQLPLALGLSLSVSQCAPLPPPPTNYHIAGNFQGRKLSRKCRKGAFHRGHFRGILNCRIMGMACLNFEEKIFACGCKITKFVKVFSLECFQLYSISLLLSPVQHHTCHIWNNIKLVPQWRHFAQ